MEKIKVLGLKIPKKIIITSGPIEEELIGKLKIMNTSAEDLGEIIANEFIKEDKNNLECIYYLSTNLAISPKYSSRIKNITFTSTTDLLRILKGLLTTEAIDVVVHSAPIGEYQKRYATTPSGLAKEIAKKLLSITTTDIDIERLILETICNPENIIEDVDKQLATNEDVMIKLSSSREIFNDIKNISPKTKLIAFKTFVQSSYGELQEQVNRIKLESAADCIIASSYNDLNKKNSYCVIEDNERQSTCDDKLEVAKQLRKIIFNTNKL